MTSFFPRFFTKNENQDMMEEVTKKKLNIVLASLNTQESNGK
jgi:hypothetical protein